MSFLNTMQITGSALTAERFRMDMIMQNITNATTTRTQNGGPYRRKQVVFEARDIDFSQVLGDEQNRVAGGGVRVKKVVESEAEFIPVYDPFHPDADQDGYVLYPNVNTTEERIDLMAASTAYEANLTALGIIKSLSVKALEIGK